MRQAYHVKRDRGKHRIESSMANQCFSCNKIFIQSKSLENHMQTCSSMPGLVYKFEKKHILTFEDIVKFMGEVSFAIYFDLETTCREKTYNFDEDPTLYPVSHVIIIAFHPKFNLDKTFIVRSLSQTFEQFNSISYLSREMIHYFHPVTAR